MSHFTESFIFPIHQTELLAFQMRRDPDFELIQDEFPLGGFLGWSASELFESPSWLGFVDEMDRQALRISLSALEKGQSFQADYRFVSKSGELTWVRSQFIHQPKADTIQGTWAILDPGLRSQIHQQRYLALLETIVESAHTLFRGQELSQGMSHVLSRIGSITQVDRVYFLGLANADATEAGPRETLDGETSFNFFAWVRQSQHSVDSPGQWLKQSSAQSSTHPVWSRLIQGESLNGNLEDFPPDIALLLAQEKIRSILLLPIIQNNQCLGVLGLENGQSKQSWTPQEVRILGQLNLTLGVALRQSHVESKLSHYAFHDPLTGLPNRALLLNRLEQCIKRKARHHCYSFAVLFLDLDRFKPINDRLGHEVGDRLLVQVAHRISRCIRPGDTVARLGGDEFVVLLDDISDLSDAETAVLRLRSEITQCFVIDGNDIFIDASIGVALSSIAYKSAEAILQKADLAMYRAKNAGKGCYRVFESSMHSQMLQRTETESDMHRALKNHEFEVYYQPIIQLETGAITGFEALARWNHPVMGVLPPNKFIPIAEETGMIKELGIQMLQLACEQVCQWQQKLPQYGALAMNVNLSPKQFVQKGLVQNIENILEATQLQPSCLHLELTESCIIHKTSETLALIECLRDLGIQIYLDDFGVGYSSLQQLNFFPLNGLKIDRMFTQKLSSSSETQAIVRSIVMMAKALNMDIVVEGIENKQQIEYLNTFPRLSGQGFLFARPLTAEYAEELLVNSERA